VASVERLFTSMMNPLAKNLKVPLNAIATSGERSFTAARSREMLGI